MSGKLVFVGTDLRKLELTVAAMQLAAHHQFTGVVAIDASSTVPLRDQLPMMTELPIKPYKGVKTNGKRKRNPDRWR